MSNYVMQEKRQVTYGQIALSTTAQQVIALTDAQTIGRVQATGISITNNDAAINIYIGYGATAGDATTGKYQTLLTPGQKFEDNLDAAGLAKLWILSASGTPNAFVTYFGQ